MEKGGNNRLPVGQGPESDLDKVAASSSRRDGPFYDGLNRSSLRISIILPANPVGNHEVRRCWDQQQDKVLVMRVRRERI